MDYLGFLGLFSLFGRGRASVCSHACCRDLGWVKAVGPVIGS